jgi:EAL domain-containing protein (putative c-di-GMP-specific phosphodiesterase class I)
MHADAIRRIEVESQLRTAIDEQQFMLYYQPTIDLQTGRLTGVEALVRWQHPRRGIVPPMEFIPLAEESGLIVPLGQWAIQEACRQVRVWQKEIPADEPIALNVNLSARQLRHPNIVRDIADALDDSGLLPSRLILEITESVLMIDTAATLNRLFQLKSLGVRLAVDDFGTGYSSFAYLRRFPVDILKIDKSFVDGVATEPTASALVDAMIRIGKTLRLETVAEGVERSSRPTGCGRSSATSARATSSRGRCRATRSRPSCATAPRPAGERRVGPAGRAARRGLSRRGTGVFGRPRLQPTARLQSEDSAAGFVDARLGDLAAPDRIQDDPDRIRGALVVCTARCPTRCSRAGGRRRR